MDLNRGQVDEGEPFTSYIFFRKDSCRAADTLMSELKAKGGTMTEKQMSDFVRSLTSGERGFKFSKQNFYAKVLGTFLKLGFIERKSPKYDSRTGKTIFVYRVVTQPVLERRPRNPSFLYHANEISRAWNELMLSSDNEQIDDG